MRAFLNSAQSALLLRLFLCLTIALQPLAWPLSQAYANNNEVPQAEIDASLDVAQRYIELTDQFEAILEAEPQDRLPLDSFSLLQQMVAKFDKKRMRTVIWNSLSLEVRKYNSADATDFENMTPAVTSFRLQDTSDFQPLRGYSNFIKLVRGDGARFDLRHPKLGYVSHFFMPSKIVGVFGNFIVFVRNDSYDQDSGIQRLSLIDLDRYENIIGNEALPVFEVPLKTNEPIEDLRIEDQSLVINGSDKRIHVTQLMYYSTIYSTLFNIKAGLIDPASMKGSLNLVESFTDYLDSMIESGKIPLKDQEIENGLNGMAELNALRRQLTKDITQQKNREVPRAELESELASSRKPGRQVINDAKGLLEANSAHLNDDQKKLMEAFAQKLMESDSLDKAITGVKNTNEASKGLIVSVRKLGTYLATPKPYASTTIKNAVAGTMAKMKLDQTNKPESVIRWLASRPLLTTGMLASSTLAVLYPESAGQFFQQGVQLATGLFNYITSVGAESSEAVVEGTAPVLYSVNPLSAIPMIDQAYVEGGNLTKTTIGISGLAISLAAVLGLYHVGQNVVRLALDRRKPDWNGLVDRQERLQKAYYQALADDEAERRRKVGKAESKWGEEENARIEQDVKTQQQRDREAKSSSWISKGWSAIKSPFQASGEFIGQKAGKVRWPFSSGKGELKDEFDKYGDLHSAAERVPENSRLSKISSLQFIKAVFNMVLSAQTRMRTGQNNSAEQKASAKDFAKAASTMIFSMYSYSRTALDYTGIWNSWTGFRASVFSFIPVKVKGRVINVPMKVKGTGLAIRLLYPEFFSTVVTKRTGKQVIPTELNGGLDNAARVINKHFKEWVMAKWRKDAASKNQAGSRKLFEDKVIDLETQIIGELTKKSIQAATRFVQNPKHLSKIYSLGGVESINSRSLNELNFRNRTFVTAYFDLAYERVMKKVLSQILERSEGQQNSLPASPELEAHLNQVLAEVGESGEISEKSLRELKQTWIRAHSALGENEGKVLDLNLSQSEVDRIVHEVTSDPQLLQQAENKALKGRLLPSNTFRKMKYDFSAHLDPKQNPTMKRYAIVQEKRKNPQSMARAVRAEVTEMFVTLPIDIGFKLWLTAGIVDGPLKPIQSEFMGPNSIAHMSRMSFYNNFMSGVAISALANSWYKLQEDAFNDDAGNFGAIPQGDEKNWSFARWWWKWFSSPSNSLWTNYKRSWTIVWNNLPMAIPNMALLQMSPIGLGRIDIELLLTTYIMAVPPIHALMMKVEQSFELAAHYDAKNAPEGELEHPAWQKYVQEKAQRRRVKFNLLRDITFNPIGEIVHNVSVTPTDTHESRGLLRAIFGATLPTEDIVNASIYLQEQTKNIPVVGGITEAASEFCERLLSNGSKEHFNIKGR